MSKKLITMMLAAIFALGVSGVTYAADAAVDAAKAATDKVVTDKAATDKAATDKAATDKAAAAAKTPKKKKVEGC